MGAMTTTPNPDRVPHFRGTRFTLPITHRCAECGRLFDMMDDTVNYHVGTFQAVGTIIATAMGDQFDTPNGAVLWHRLRFSDGFESWVHAADCTPVGTTSDGAR